MTDSKVLADTKLLEQETRLLEKKLAQKKLFEDSLEGIVNLIFSASKQSLLCEISTVLSGYFRRARTLLRSRYTNATFWTAAEEAVKKAQVGS